MAAPTTDEGYGSSANSVVAAPLPILICATEADRDLNWGDGIIAYCKDTGKTYIGVAGAWANLAMQVSAFIQTLLDDANQAAAQATLGVVPGTHVQAQNATLQSLASLIGSGADTLGYFSGASTFAVTNLSSFVRTLLDDGDAATARTTLGAAANSSKLYIKDAAGTPHYWQLTISTLGILTTTDVGTSAPSDGMIVIP